MQRYRTGVLTYGPLASGWLSGRTDPAGGMRSQLDKHAFNLESPGNQAKIVALEKLRDLAAAAGLPLAHLALAFVRAHPAVTSVLIGPRTMEQLDGLLGAAVAVLTDDILDRIDEIVPPGTELNAADNYGADTPAITDKRLRRRAYQSPA